MAEQLTIQITDRHVRVSNGDPSAALVEAHELPTSAAALAPTELAEVIRDALKILAKGQTPATLILPSSWCYVHRLSVPRRRPSRATLAYALEEYLPVEIEQLTCDFVRCGDGAVIGVAVETERLGGLLAALSDGGVATGRITLDIIHAAQRRPVTSGLLWCDAEHVTLLSSNDGHVTDLRVARLAPDLEADDWVDRVCHHLECQEASTAQAPRLVAGCVDDDRLAAVITRLNTAPADNTNDNPSRASIARDFDLARDALAPAERAVDRLRTWRRIATASLVTLLTFCAGLVVHQSRLDSQLGAVAEWERGCFRELFPGQPVPAGIALRVASERRRLEGLTRSNAPATAEAPDALAVLHDLVAALPDDLRLDLQELRIEGRDVTIRGTARDHRQAERLTQAIDAMRLLQCPAPRTDRRREGGVQFFAHARFVEDVGSDTEAKP